MDQEILVNAGHVLVELLDQTPIKPVAAMWVHNPESDIWRLWIVSESKIAENEFYRILAASFAKHRDELSGLDISSVELVERSHPAIEGLARFARVEGLSSVFLSNSTMNGFFLPDGIIIRMCL